MTWIGSTGSVNYSLWCLVFWECFAGILTSSTCTKSLHLLVPLWFSKILPFLNFSRASNFNHNMYSSICLVASLMASSMYRPPPMVIAYGPHMSECTSCSGSVAREVMGVKCIRAHFHFIQLSQSHCPVISGTLLIISKVAKDMRPMCAKWRCPYIHISAWCEDAYPVIVSASRQLSLLIMVSSVDSGSRTHYPTNCPSTWGVVAIVAVETVVIHWIHFDVLVRNMRLQDEIELSQQMHDFLKYDHFRLSIWRLTIQPTTSISGRKW